MLCNYEHIHVHFSLFLDQTFVNSFHALSRTLRHSGSPLHALSRTLRHRVASLIRSLSSFTPTILLLLLFNLVILLGCPVFFNLVYNNIYMFTY